MGSPLYRTHLQSIELGDIKHQLQDAPRVTQVLHVKEDSLLSRMERIFFHTVDSLRVVTKRGAVLNICFDVIGEKPIG
ncbi:hypothetical protein NDU88_001628 [Pleurodeles waltl]|uniref:Uncharacterized protein n=1 Tax=Pleurodeles waltl TaxID=8319 RepID=A0AAV7KQ22_PLEWA|nr:hypothetical protein NDU88_001628 [Pleurodeles waltl]